MDALTFLQTIFRECTGNIEIRLVHEDGRPPERRHFALPGALPAAAAYCRSQAGRAHVFFGVYPRIDTRGRNGSVAEVQGLYADLDSEAFPGGATEIDRRLAHFLPPPTLIVGSGTGRHAYWLFRLPVALNAVDHTTGEKISHREAVRQALWAVADALGVPPEKNTVHDLARLLRVPGSTNIKPKYVQPLPCTVLLARPERRCDPSDFLHIIEAALPRWHSLHGGGPGARPEVRFTDDGRWTGRTLDEVLSGLRLAGETRRLIRQGAPAGSRSERCQSAIVALLAAGADPECVRAVLTHPEAGIAAKYRDEERHGNGERWLVRSIGAAIGFLAEHNPPRRTPRASGNTPGGGGGNAAGRMRSALSGGPAPCRCPAGGPLTRA